MRNLSPRRALFLHGASESDVRAARRAGYALRTIVWALDTADAPRRAAAKRAALKALPDLGEAHPRASQWVTPDMPDAEIRDLANWRAALVLHLIGELREPVTLEWLAATVEDLQGTLPRVSCMASAEELQACVKRACCRFWWRRQLRRVAGQAREARAAQDGELGKGQQVYVTDETARRHAAQRAANQAMLERTEIEDADGNTITLAAAVNASVANRAIRRGELMTRIRGAEEWAAARGLAGLFTTNTAPSRFHPAAGRNEKFDGSTPADAQRWLCKTWARTRAALARAKVAVMGYRVAEPHQDGCPHWHMLLWAKPDQLDKLQAIMREHWLRDEGDEPGAQRYRVNFKAMEHGGAAGYVAKYISKGIDDHGAVGAEGHRDEEQGAQVDAIGGNAKRVEAWASQHRIRQFQAIGQPPVTVWRELRRVSYPAAQSASLAVQEAREAVNRSGGRRACWRRYMEAQGGAMTGRGYRIALAGLEERREGRYGAFDALRILGVVDREAGPVIIESERKQWRPRGCWGQGDRNTAQLAAVLGVASAKRAQPWTRVNNCTQQQGGIAALWASGIVGAVTNRGPGGLPTEENPCLKSGPPSRSPIPSTPAPRPPASSRSAT